MLNPFTHRKILRKGVPGRAMIVERGALNRGGTSFNLPMTLQVHVEGRTPYEVEDEWMVKAKDTVALTGWLPVRVDRDDPERVAIVWDEIRERYEQQTAARRQALADGPVVAGGGADALARAGVDPNALEQAEEALSAMGISVDLSDAIVTTYGAPPPADEDDTIAKLERLAALRDSGALTEEEFAEQKRRLLDGA